MSRDDQFGFEQCWTEYDENGRAMTFCDYSTDRGNEPPATEPPKRDYGQYGHPHNNQPADHCLQSNDPFIREACQTMAGLPKIMRDAADSGQTDGYIGQFLDGVHAVQDNYVDMRLDNTKYGDKYFHCKANCQATRKGLGGKHAAEAMGWVREEVLGRINLDSAEDREADYRANQHGMDNADQDESCSNICSVFRVNGINERY